MLRGLLIIVSNDMCIHGFGHRNSGKLKLTFLYNLQLRWFIRFGPPVDLVGRVG
jgi:hypothetical protein